jgi:hypothetical protein
MPPPAWAPVPTATGAFHLHTNRSDGSGSPDAIAAATARAGLQFVILTDHGDGTRTPDPPQYRSGVLTIDAVEISTSGGHYIAIGLPQSPYPLGGDVTGVIEDVARLGGFGIVAHPDSAKTGLQWRDWAAPFDGIEWLNADSEWRDERRERAARALASYPFRPVETLGSFLDRPETTLMRWDALTQRRPVVALAGADAHARVGWRSGDDTDGYGRGWFLPLPSYEVSLRSFALRARLDAPLSGNAAQDAANVIAAIRSGRVYSGIDAIATPATLEFSATHAGGVAREGDVIPPNGPVAFQARVNAPSGGVIVLRKDGAIAAEGPVPRLTFETPPGAGVYRVEVHLDTRQGRGQRAEGGRTADTSVPWIVSNPIYVQPAGWGTPRSVPRPETSDSWPIQSEPWKVEKDAVSTAEIRGDSTADGPVELSFRLAAGPRAGQYAALALSTGNALRGHRWLSFSAHASRPMRISVQARRPHSGDRWQRSVYLDRQPRDIIVRFTDMMPVSPHLPLRFNPEEIDALLFVTDTVNATPGSAGSFTISDVRVEH